MDVYEGNLDVVIQMISYIAELQFRKNSKTAFSGRFSGAFSSMFSKIWDIGSPFKEQTFNN